MTTNQPERLSTEQIALTSKYLEDVRERYSTPVLAVQSLFGRCCLAMLPESPLCWDVLANESSRLASNILTYPNAACLDLDPLPIIEICLMMKEESGGAPELQELLAKISPELNTQSIEVRSMGRVRLIASLLAQLDLPSPVATPSKSAAALLSDYERWLTAPAAHLSDLADHLIADHVQLDETNTSLISLIALGELRSYRIDVGCKLLRAALELGKPCEETRDGVDFMALQRRRNGRYGFPDRLTENTSQMADPELNLFLPMTLNAAWLFKIEAASLANSNVLAVTGAGA